MVEKVIRGGIYHSIYRYVKANKKYRKYYDKNKELPYIQNWDINNVYGWVMSQKLPVNNFGLDKNTSQFNEEFMKRIMKKVMKDIFLKLMFNILKNYMNFIMIRYFWPIEWKFK